MSRLLRDRAYIGLIEAFCGTFKTAPPFVPIVDEAVFFAVQELLMPRNRPFRTYNRLHPDFPLRGTLRCTYGALMMACWSHGSNKLYAY
jgi:hypothetical protein